MFDLEEKIIEFLYKWHRYEEKNGVSIIDFDLLQLSNKYRGQYESREEVYQKIKDLLTEGTRLLSQNSPITAKLEACKYFLEALMGVTIDFKQYIEHTMGVTPEYIPEDQLQSEKAKLIETFTKIGYSWDKESVIKYENEQKIPQNNIEEKFNNFKNITVPKVMEWLGIKFDLHYHVIFVNKDEYWTNWTSTDKNGELLLQFNINERQKWVNGITEYQVFHEICGHALQTAIWKSEIQKGTMSRIFGLTSVFAPEQFTSEGIGETLFYFYPDNPYTDYGLIRQYQENFFFMVWNNAHIMANEGKSFNKIEKFIQTYIPYLSKQDVQKGIKEKTQDPLGRCYQYIYGISTYYHKKIASKLSKEEKRKFILDSYKNIYYPKEIINRYL